MYDSPVKKKRVRLEGMETAELKADDFFPEDGCCENGYYTYIRECMYNRQLMHQA
jgi:hypothetical protein